MDIITTSKLSTPNISFRILDFSLLDMKKFLENYLICLSCNFIKYPRCKQILEARLKMFLKLSTKSIKLILFSAPVPWNPI